MITYEEALAVFAPPRWARVNTTSVLGRARARLSSPPTGGCDTEHGDVLKVPTSALFRHDEGWAVFVEENGVARLRTLRAGQRTGSSAEVLDGLQAGDRVIEHPSDQVTDGSRVASRALR